MVGVADLDVLHFELFHPERFCPEPFPYPEPFRDEDAV